MVSGLLNDEKYESLAATFIAEESDQEFETLFHSLYQKPKFRATFNAPVKTIEKFFEKNIYRQGVAPRRFLALYKCLFIEHRSELNAFATLRLVFENHVLCGRYEAAGEILDQMRSLLGESLWLVRNRILLLSLQGKLQEMHDFSESCKDRCTDGFVTFLINCFVLVASDPLLHLRKFIRNTIEELSEAGIGDWADLLALVFVPRPMFAGPGKLKCLPVIQSFNVIDQYELVTRFAAESLPEGGPEAKTDVSIEEITDFLDSLREHISDNAMPAVERANSDPQAVYTLDNVVKLYEADLYKEALDEFSRNIHSLQTPFALANIAAKARAISSSDLESEKSEGPVFDFIRNMQALYDLSMPPSQAAEPLSSLIVQFHHFTGNSQMQLCLYKCMPLHHNADDVKWLSRVTLFSTVDSTPWARLLSTDADPILSHRYLTPRESLPKHRKTKDQVRRDSPKGSSAMQLLEQYRQECVLQKDYLELASAYLQQQGLLRDLIPLCAITLSTQPNAYVCFPMRELCLLIEESRESSLDAVIIAHYYVKKIDAKKEYLLNEAFEEYIFSSGVERPGDLTDELSHDDLRSVVFFRDICTLETMDFLGSFEDSNDLRAERVRILDFLRDKDLLDPESHRAEVDEIVMQVVVDSGATQFNVAKIDVNDSAIRRAISQDVSSLLSLYKSVKDGTEEKFFRVDGQITSDDGPQAVVAGDKNTTMLKIVNLVQDAFLNDEKHGLDKNLSAEIRHGFFSNLMRSKLEEAKLITELDEDGNYKSNNYWLETNAIIVHSVLQEIDEQLKWFSASFNDLIAQAEEWMKVSSDSSDKSRVFNYKVLVHDFRMFHAQAEAVSSGEEFLDFCLETLWKRTELHLQEMREKLNVDLRASVDRLFDELIAKINSAKGGVALVELMSSIVKAKSDIQEDITTVSEWFRRQVDYVSHARSLNDLIDISVECFERVKGAKLNITKSADDLSLVEFAGRNIKSFIVALVNILENACRHSGYGVATDIQMTTRGRTGDWKISIENVVTEAKLELLTNERMTQIREKMKGPSSLHMMRREGGSGLSKAYNQLRSVSELFDIAVSRQNRNFVTEVRYG
ncbi:hypothetical protein SAMN05446935_7630 [Burkholderia sp. YR290]|nr:hypothetical protein SAMN05446935_7630 [Burkholderia sp. YR290]